MYTPETNQEAYNRGFEMGKFEGRQEGIKEVVKFVENNACRDSWGDTLQELAIDKKLVLDAQQWRDYLKESGIDA